MPVRVGEAVGEPATSLSYARIAGPPRPSSLCWPFARSGIAVDGPERGVIEPTGLHHLASICRPSGLDAGRGAALDVV